MFLSFHFKNRIKKSVSKNIQEDFYKNPQQLTILKPLIINIFYEIRGINTSNLFKRS